MTHGWDKQAMILRFDFDREPFCAALEIFECVEVAEEIYEGFGAPSQTNQPRADANQVIGRKKQGGEPASPTGSEKNCAH